MCITTAPRILQSERKREKKKSLEPKEKGEKLLTF
jgi:hypothetical protein